MDSRLNVETRNSGESKILVRQGSGCLKSREKIGRPSLTVGGPIRYYGLTNALLA
jgi:hypothetical protein